LAEQIAEFIEVPLKRLFGIDLVGVPEPQEFIERGTIRHYEIDSA
jgi:hypothetical protein